MKSKLLRPSSEGINPARRFYLCNLRSLLTALVIAHHTAIAYGGTGIWPYHSQFERHQHSTPLFAFNVINQTFFMASFFFLSGHFSSVSLAKKSPHFFLYGKFLRLGVPAMISTIFWTPVQLAIARVGARDEIEYSFLFNYWRGLKGVRGPVWYCTTLLCFDAIAASLRELSLVFPSGSKIRTSSPMQNCLTLFSSYVLLIGIIITIITSFLIRLYYPIGTTFVPLSLQLGYLPQYVTAYILGFTVTSLENLTLSLTTILSLASSAVLASTIAFKQALDISNGKDQRDPIDEICGGWNLLAVCYAVLNETVGLLLGVGILSFFRKYLNREWGIRGLGEISQSSYAAFLAHPVVSVGLQTAFDKWDSGAITKTISITALTVIGSWILGWAALRIPGWKNILG